MKRKILSASIYLLCMLFKGFPSFGQLILNRTSSIKWAAATNRTSALPLASEGIIADANFTGSNQQGITAYSSCKALQIGGGAKASTLFLNKI